MENPFGPSVVGVKDASFCCMTVSSAWATVPATWRLLKVIGDEKGIASHMPGDDGSSPCPHVAESLGVSTNHSAEDPGPL